MSGDSSSARLERLSALVARAPRPMAWIQLCAELSEWPDHEVGRAIEFLRPRLSMWPPSLRTAPEWWRVAWEEGRDEPRLELAAALAGPLLPARGGGSHPVQYDVFHEDRVYYVRYRSGCLSVTLERVGARGVDRDLVELMPDCLEDDDRWTHEETHALLSLISAALRRYQISRLRLPGTRAELRDSPFFMLGPYPLLCPRGPCSDPAHAHDERCFDTLQAANWRLSIDAARFPGVAAARHHLSPVRPGHVGPWPRGGGRARPSEAFAAAVAATRCDVTVTSRYRAHQDAISVCAFLPDGRLLTGSEDHALWVWSRGAGESFALQGHADEVTCSARLPDGRVVSGSADGTLRVWSLRRRSCDRTLRGHSLPVGQIVTLGDTIVSIDRGGAVLRWNLATGAYAPLSEGTGRAGRLVALSEDRVALGCGEITVWSKTEGDISALRQPRRWLTPWFALPDGRLIVDAGGRLQAWDVEEARVTASIHAHDWSIFDCAPLGERRVVSASEDHTLRVWDVQTGWSRLLYGHEDELDMCAALGDGRIVSYAEDQTLRVWEAETGRCQAVFATGFDVYSMAVRDRVVALGGGDGELVMLEIGAPRGP